MKAFFARLISVIILSSISTGLVFALSYVEPFTEKAEISTVQLEMNPKERHYFEAPNENFSLEGFLAEGGLQVSRPYLRVLDRLNPDKNFYTVDRSHVLELDGSAEALIIEITKVRDEDSFAFSINDSNGNKEVYHNIREIVYQDAWRGNYTFGVASSTFDQVGVQIFAAEVAYPSAPLLLFIKEDIQFVRHQAQIAAYLGRGGTVLNIGSDKLHRDMVQTMGEMKRMELEGEDKAIEMKGGYYFYVPEELFRNEDVAKRVISLLKEKMDLSGGLQTQDGVMTLVLIVFIFAILGLFFQHRKTAKLWAREHLLPGLRRFVVWGAIFAVLLIIVLPLSIYWYKNYSGLDLFPGFSIDEFVDKYSLRLVAKLFLAIIAFVFILFAGLIAWLGEKEETMFSRFAGRLKSFFRDPAQRRQDWLFLVAALAIVVGAFFVVFMKPNTAATQQFHAFQGSIVLDKGQYEVLTPMPMVLSKGLKEYKIEESFPSPSHIRDYFKQSAVDGSSSIQPYLYSKRGIYYGKFEGQIEGEILVRNKNEEFGNDGFYVHLIDLDGKHKATLSMQGHGDLIGSGVNEITYPFTFTLPEPGIYGIEIENSDPLSVGDYEIIGMKINSGALVSLNTFRNAKWRKFSVEEDGTTLMPYQFEQISPNRFWVRTLED